MNRKFTNLAQANVDHYNDHPVTHTVSAVVWLVSGLIMIGWLARFLTRNSRS